MLNILWFMLMLIAVVVGVIENRVAEVVTAVTTSAKLAFEIALGLTGIMAFWLGLMKIAEHGGLIQAIANLLKPLLRRLFPDVPSDHPAMGAMVMNISANALGLTNAATPFGLRAMEELERLNPFPGVATNAMCTFLAINTSSVQLIPTTAIVYLAAAGATHPTQVIISSLVATTCSTIAGLVAVKFFEKLPFFKVIPIIETPTSNVSANNELS
jgi:spore maturation protein A